MTRVTLELPEPPSPNQVKRRQYVSAGWATKEKNALKRKTWLEAVQQHPPTTSPPDPVLVKAHFRLHNLRDEDNLTAAMKPVLDALRLPREDEHFPWRGGLYDRKGYFVDDGPEHLTLEKPTQEINRSERGLTLDIVPLDEVEEAA